MSEIEQVYLEWLCNQVGDGTSYWPLLAVLHKKEFVWLIPNDDNRIYDAEDLRIEFMNDPAHRRWVAESLHPFYSVLEVLIGLSRRLEFVSDRSALSWAEQLLENLELHKMVGNLTKRQMDYVDEIVDRLIFRNYQPDGVGGFFPLGFPEEDQRKVEIWYQMSSYLEEQVQP